MQSLIRIKDVTPLTGKSKLRTCCQIKKDLFTPPIKIGPRRTPRPEQEVNQIIRAEIVSTPPPDVQRLSNRLAQTP